MDKLEGSKWAGKFAISPGRDIYGEISFAGSRTCLYLQDKEPFDPHGISDGCLRGISHDLTRITLIDCVTISGPGSANKGDERYSFASIFPHYVVYGDYHISPNEKTITEVHFVIDDATTLFYDFDAFGSLLDARPFIETIAHANRLDREVPTGPNPAILYFTGKRQIFKADTEIGKISANHNPSHNIGGPGGVQLDNTIVVSIEFREPVIFEDAMLHTLTLNSYLGMLVGRPQNLLKLSVRIQSGHDRPALNVYWYMSSKRELSREEKNPHPGDVLMDAVWQSDKFSEVLANWLRRQRDWHEARGRFFNCFAEQRRYSTDRLIGAANMFDILPSSAVPADIPISKDLENAKQQTRTIFRALTASPERDSILSALGRIGKASLRQKIRHRAQPLTDAIGTRFPELITVSNQAVNCRNYYVHGSTATFDYSGNFDMVIFFTDTLEFVFAASDLIDAGWDVRSWIKSPTGMSHPFGRFRVDYAERLQSLKSLLPA